MIHKKLGIPRRTIFYGLLAFGQLMFTLIFPWFSVPVVSWFMRHNIYHKTILTLSAPFFLLLGYFSWKRWHLIKKDRKLILILAAAVILYIAVYETVPDFGEKLHVLNYSVLAILLYKTLSPLMKLQGAMLLSWVLTSLIGGADEYMQRFIPGRDGSIHDVLIAVRSAVLGGIIAWIFDAYSRKGRG